VVLQLGLDVAVHSLVAAVVLWTAGAAAQDADSQRQSPSREPREPALAAACERGAVVGEMASGKPKRSKSSSKTGWTSAVLMLGSTRNASR
jgi:hypothetical protein